MKLSTWKEFKKLKVILARIEASIAQLRITQEKIVSDLEKAMAAIQTINDSTNEQGDSLLAISTNLDVLIAKMATTVPPDVLAGLQAQADHIKLQAEFSKALASKGVDTPVPLAVPATVALAKKTK